MKYLYVILLITVSLSTHASETLRCNQHIVSTGDTLTTVLEKCGEPTETREYSQPATYINSAGDRVIDPGKLPTEYQEWTYNFGSSRLMRRIYAADNKVTKIETLGYGN